MFFQVKDSGKLPRPVNSGRSEVEQHIFKNTTSVILKEVPQ